MTETILPYPWQTDFPEGDYEQYCNALEWVKKSKKAGLHQVARSWERKAFEAAQNVIDDLRAQLAARTEECDQARRVAEQLANVVVVADHPETGMLWHCLCCHARGSKGTRLTLKHAEDCPVKFVEELINGLV